MPYRCSLQLNSQAVLPGKADDMGQIQSEVDDSTAGSCQISLGEEGAEQEALHDAGCAEGQQEQKEEVWIAVVKHFAILERK